MEKIDENYEIDSNDVGCIEPIIDSLKQNNEPITFSMGESYYDITIAFQDNKLLVFYNDTDIDIDVSAKIIKKFRKYEDEIFKNIKEYHDFNKLIIKIKTSEKYMCFLCKEYYEFIGIITINNDKKNKSKYTLVLFEYFKLGMYRRYYNPVGIFYSDLLK